jgi:ABC-type cobalamin/Fe3+-siderophores transport system ATPase subunit
MSADPTFRTTIRLRGVSKEFGAGAGSCTASVAALDGASVEIRGGEVLLVCGPCGAGKTTLLLCAAGLLHCDAGDVLGGGRRVAYRDLAHPTPILDGWPASGAIFLDSCDAIGESARLRAANAISAALASGSAVVLAARDSDRCLDLVPAAATVSIVHLRLGKVTDHRPEIGVVHRVAEAGGGGY